MELDINIISKMKHVTTLLKEKFVNITFVGLIQRVENETWDIVIGGDDINNDVNKATIAKILSESFLRSEIVIFSGFVLLNSTNSFIHMMRQMNSGLSFDNSQNRIINTRVGQIFIKNSYIFFST